MNITIGTKTFTVDTTDINEVMTDTALEDRLEVVIIGETSYLTNQGQEAKSKKEAALNDRINAAFATAGENETKADIIARVEAEIASEEAAKNNPVMPEG